MLKKLNLEKFGKFSNKIIDFNPITVFFGDNEAGKSTIFDAILSVLCSKPRGRNDHWKRISERYVGHISPEATFDKDYNKLDTNEFINLYAVHAGKISIKWEEGSTKWISEIKRDFNGGFDPTTMMAKFENNIAVKKDGTDKDIGRYNPKLTEWREEQKKLAEELKERMNRRSQILSKKQSTDSLQGEIGKFEIEESELTKRYGEEKAKLEWENKIMEKQKYNETLTQIGKLKELEKSYASSPFRVDESPVLSQKKGVIDNILSDLKAAESLVKDKMHEQRSRSQKIIEIEKNLPALKRKAENADSLQNDISKVLSAGAAEGKWNTAYVGVAGISLVAGLLLALLLTDPAMRLVAGLIGVVSAIIFLVLGRPKGGLSIENPIEEIKGRWKLNFGEDLKEYQPSVILRQLAEFRSNYIAKDQALQAENNDVAKLKSDLLGLETNIERLKKEKQEREDELTEWLRQRGVENELDYAEKKAKYEQDKKELFKLQKQFEGGDLGGMESKFRSLYSGLHNEGVPDNRAMSDEALVLLKKTTQELEEKIKELDKDKTQKEKDKKGIVGEIRGALEQSGLNDAIAKMEFEISDLEQRITDYELAKKATAKALEILNIMEQDSEKLFQELAKDVSEWLKEVLPDRKIDIKALKEADIKMEDATGKLRPVEYLSSGTYDTFMFAMRLALARKSANEQWRPLLLDEPFLYMDSQRTENALKLLKTFQEKTKWQIILFTKEKKLKDLAEKTFSDTQCYELSVFNNKILNDDCSQQRKI